MKLVPPKLRLKISMKMEPWMNLSKKVLVLQTSGHNKARKKFLAMIVPKRTYKKNPSLSAPDQIFILR